jgi:hypothetical protein
VTWGSENTATAPNGRLAPTPPYVEVRVRGFITNGYRVGLRGGGGMALMAPPWPRDGVGGAVLDRGWRQGDTRERKKRGVTRLPYMLYSHYLLKKQ